jgi:hypothetical protein
MLHKFLGTFFLTIGMLSFGLSAANATTLYSCSLGGDFKVVDNVVRDGVTCSGVAVIPAGVTAIGVEAFKDAGGLTSVTFARWSDFHWRKCLLSCHFTNQCLDTKHRNLDWVACILRGQGTYQHHYSKWSDKH